MSGSLSPQYCLERSGQEGSCCRRRSEPVTQSPSTSHEVTCQGSQECVTPDLCDENGRIITDGAGLINARFNTREVRLRQITRCVCKLGVGAQSPYSQSWPVHARCCQLS